MSTPFRDDIVFQETDDVGIIIFNRPKDLNAVNLHMIFSIGGILEDFEKFKSLVIVKSVVPKVFSAGGDIVRVTELVKLKDKTCLYYPRYGYKMIHSIGTMKIPFVALNDGLTMGGGAGISMLSKYFVCTENTDFSMPEVRMGHFADVCSSYFLARLDNHLGFYLALTGARLKGYDNVLAGIATHFCPSEKIAELEVALLNNPQEADAIIKSFSAVPENANFSLTPHLEKIERIFSSETVEEILAKLEQDGSKWAKTTIATIRYMCPLSLKATLRQLRIAKTMSLEQCIQNEYILANSFFQGENFVEGKPISRRGIVIIFP